MSELLQHQFLEFLSTETTPGFLRRLIDEEQRDERQQAQQPLPELRISLTAAGSETKSAQNASPKASARTLDAGSSARPATPPSGSFELPAAVVMRTPDKPSSAGRPSTPEGPGARLSSPKLDLARLASPPRSPARRVGTGTRSPMLRSGLPIAKFYFPGGVPQSPGTDKRYTSIISECFKGSQQGLTKEQFHRVTMDVCNFSSYTHAALFERVLQHAALPVESKNASLIEAAVGDVGAAAAASLGLSKDSQPAALPQTSDGKPLVTEAMFLRYWHAELARFEPVTRLFRMLKKRENNFLVRDDFRLVVQDIVNRHPGLEFLESHPDFQLKYAQTVIARIFYTVNKTGNEQLSLRELKQSNLIKMLHMLDEEEDINKINDFFSYEHFYVIYCNFWSLDTDHDGLIDATDLMRYEDCSLTGKIVERVCGGFGRKLLSGIKGKLSYYDFLVFLISEVDKTTDVAIEYWFRCVDVDGDGVIAAYELEHFFGEQKTRMQALSQETIRFADVLCQLVDMIKPAVTGQFTKKDLRNNPQMSALFFNTLFNLHRYVAFEQRDPHRIAQMHAHPDLTEWDRFAIAGYYRLSDGDGGAGAGAGAGGGGGGGGMMQSQSISASIGAGAQESKGSVSWGSLESKEEAGGGDDDATRRTLDFSGSAGGAGSAGSSGSGSSSRFGTGPDRDHELLLESDSDEDMDDVMASASSSSSGSASAGSASSGSSGLTRTLSSSQLLASVGASALSASLQQQSQGQQNASDRGSSSSGAGAGAATAPAAGAGAGGKLPVKFGADVR